MPIIVRCDGCGRTWYERRDVLPPPDHGHVNWGLLAPPLLAIGLMLIVVAFGAIR